MSEVLWKDEKTLRYLLIERGYTKSEAAARLGCSYHAIRGQCSTYNIDLSERTFICDQCGRDFDTESAIATHNLCCQSEPWSDRETLRRLRVDEELSYEEMAEELGCSPDTIRNQIGSYDIDEAADYPCPWDGCERSFDSEGGMKVHHEKTHGESIAGILSECHTCGTSTRAQRCDLNENERTFCSDECQREWQSEKWSGAGSPVWKGGEVELVCKQCEDVFTVSCYRGDVAQFCSQECYWVGGKAESDCEWCGETYTVHNFRAEDSRFCSSACNNSHLGSVTGSDHWSWRGGHRITDAIRREMGSKSWNAIREDILERDGRECQSCGDNATESGHPLHVHHIVPLLDGGTHADELLTTLCATCHKKVESTIWEFSERAIRDFTEEELPDGRLSSEEFMAQVTNSDTREQTELGAFVFG